MAKISAHGPENRRDDASSFDDRVCLYRRCVDEELERWLCPANVTSTRLLQAMRYALLDGGKRIRPLLAYSSGELLAVSPGRLDAIAAAIEMIHAYSLVHDDLPAMDDDELRRGKPTVHVAYDEATAILAGDALQALAFQVLCEHPALTDSPLASRELMLELTRACGGAGMASGQTMDLEYSGRDVRRDEIEQMFAHKTGRLITAAITMPQACAEDVSDGTRCKLRRFAETAGLCFQIQDDILDVTASTEQLGKPSQSDERNDRSAYPARFGLEVARERVQQLYASALRYLDELGPGTEGLRWITRYIVERDH